MTGTAMDDAAGVTVRALHHWDAIEPGLATWLRDIIDASARGEGIDPDSATRT
ncbi:hypothetical protein [Actinomadura kijaniata]|uniref:hypothetical protein n=1 Tax=Actinomadura kijaniata TaxID=46161 RepID=UPI000AE53A11|nr:hypothetical protein [Actinomadura kijaniata]